MFLGEGCPSPLLGVCPPCKNCLTSTTAAPTTATTTTEVPPSNVPVIISEPPGNHTNSSVNDSEYYGHLNVIDVYHKPNPKKIPASKIPLSSLTNLPKFYTPKHRKLKSGAFLSYVKNQVPNGRNRHEHIIGRPKMNIERGHVISSSSLLIIKRDRKK